MFVTDIFGLIIAFCNVMTFLLLVYLLLLTIDDDRSKVYKGLDRIFSPLLRPIRSVLPEWRIDISPILLAVLIQVVAMMVRKVW